MERVCHSRANTNILAHPYEKNFIMMQEVEEKTAVRNEVSPRRTPTSVDKPKRMPQTTAAEPEPLYSGYALTPGIMIVTLLTFTGTCMPAKGCHVLYYQQNVAHLVPVSDLFIFAHYKIN